jgi:GntR family transcriptional regulator of vanillate catabolism
MKIFPEMPMKDDLQTSLQSTENLVDRLVLQMRELMMAGEFAPGERIAEIPIAKRFGVSRTPVRLALSVLEKEGLVVGRPRRGYVVRQVTINEIMQAIAVSGVLEGMACGMIARQGLTLPTRVALEVCLEEGEEIIAKPRITEHDAMRWADMNGRFHQAIVAAANSLPLESAVAFNSRRPFVAARAIFATTNTLELSLQRMKTAQVEHRQVLDALKRGDAERADFLMRDHSDKSSEALRMRFETVLNSSQKNDFPALRLMAEG